MNKVRHLLRHYPLTLICLALIIYLSLLVNMPETPLDDVAFIDKWTHMVMYGGTAGVMWWEYLRCHRQAVEWGKLWLYAIIGLTALGGVIEIVQPYCHRSGEWLDFVADAVGVGLGAVFGLLVRRLR